MASFLQFLNRARVINTGRNIRSACLALGFKNVPQHCYYLTNESDEFVLAAMVAINQQGE